MSYTYIGGGGDGGGYVDNLLIKLGKTKKIYYIVVRF